MSTHTSTQMHAAHTEAALKKTVKARGKTLQYQAKPAG